jgi:hypothetical protein
VPLPGRAKQLGYNFANHFTHWLLHSFALPSWRRRTQVRLAQDVLASPCGTTPILTLPLKARADQILGLSSQTLVFQAYCIARDFDFDIQPVMEWLQRHACGLNAAFEKLLLAWALCCYDVFHFFYDQGLTARTTRFGVNPA